MARDLIPPPSPAGRPLPDGVPRLDGVPHLIELPPEPVYERAETAPPAARVDLPPSRFRNRFGFLMGALGGVVVTMVALIVLAVSSSSSTDSAAGEGVAPNWSAWSPADDSAVTGAPEIAAHVGPEYRLDQGGAQLVQVSGFPIDTGGSDLHMAVRPQTGNIQELNGHALVYTLNGLGPDGSINAGTASRARHQLVRREALELALYSFRYLKDVDTVVALLPPALPVNVTSTTTTDSPTPITLATLTTKEMNLQALVYRPGDLKAQLQVPLGYTLPAKPLTPATMGGSDGDTVDSLTLSNLFQASFEHAQDQTAYLVLDHAQFK